ncbi:MFS transporter [Asanoa iriomotensis]|uniref:MFS transporter n=1 Tax=Asanoa iriomotensis TaxID=234613 RepID=A0ABQ4C4S8_9ACTN|nr:MFS transporter [Asanoa iriomotensis]GIF57401.1 MFS transporter [Asanoa iriomotensis]
MKALVRALRERPRRLADTTFRSLRVRNYRLFFIGNTVSVVGTWMQRVAQDWLVYSLTGDGVALGIAAALQFGPMLLFGIVGGSIADRFDRRKILIGTQIGQALLALALGLLVVTDSVSLSLVYLVTLLLGLVSVVDFPARQSFVGDVVPRDSYVNAQSLNSTIHNTGRLVGPAIAGVLIAAAGVGPAFLINAVSFVAVIIGLVKMRPGEMQERARPKGRVKSFDGVRYILKNPRLRGCMIIILIVAVFGQNFRIVLPLLSSETFHGGPEQYGYLTASMGVGAVAGALWVASRDSMNGRFMLLATCALAAANLIVGIAPSIYVAYLAMVGLGFANICVNTAGRVLLMLNSPEEMHGRVLAVHGLVFVGSTPFGGPLLGWVCEALGARAGMEVAALTAVVAAALAAPALFRDRAAVREVPSMVGGRT